MYQTRTFYRHIQFMIYNEPEYNILQTDSNHKVQCTRQNVLLTVSFIYSVLISADSTDSFQFIIHTVPVYSIQLTASFHILHCTSLQHSTDSFSLYSTLYRSSASFHNVHHNSLQHSIDRFNSYSII